MGFFLVMKAELVRNFIVMRRYWFRTVIGMTVSYGMLLVFMLAFARGGQGVEEATAKIMDVSTATRGALGFIVGTFAFAVVGMFSQGLTAMAQNGQLEQLCMSPHGLITNFLARSVVSSISMVTTSSILFYLLAKSVGGTLHADFVPTLVLLALTFANLIGFGFMVGGLVLIFKKTGQVTTIIRLVLLALAILATDKMQAWPAIGRWFAHALPITDAAICIKYVLIDGQMRVMSEGISTFRSVFSHPSFYFLIGSCVFWTTAGIICFRIMENYSRHKGTLGAY